MMFINSIPNISMKKFLDLEPAAKLEAVLAILKEPISQEDLLYFAAVNIDQLSTDSRSRIAGLFNNLPATDTSSTKSIPNQPALDQGTVSEPLYFIPAAQKPDVLQRLNVDEQTVMLHVAEMGAAHLDQLEGFN